MRGWVHHGGGMYEGVTGCGEEGGGKKVCTVEVCRNWKGWIIGKLCMCARGEYVCVNENSRSMNEVDKYKKTRSQRSLYCMLLY